MLGGRCETHDICFLRALVFAVIFLFQVYVLQPGWVSAEGEELGEEDVPFQHLLVHPPGRRENHVQGAGFIGVLYVHTKGTSLLLR